MYTQNQQERSVMSIEQLKVKAPSIFAAKPFWAVSEKYAFIPTIDVVESLGKENWLPVDASESRVNISGKSGYQKHSIRFQKVQQTDLTEQNTVKQGEVAAELVLTNSHDRSSTFVFMAGLYRLICANGLIAFDPQFGQINSRHMGAGRKDEVLNAAFQIIENMPKVLENVEKLRGISMTVEEQFQLAEQALKLRWEENAPIQASALLTVQNWIDRFSDEHDADKNHPRSRMPKLDLWTTFNTIQENLMKGGHRGKSTTGRRTTTQAVRSVGLNIKLNQELWSLAEDFRQKKAA